MRGGNLPPPHKTLEGCLRVGFEETLGSTLECFGGGGGWRGVLAEYSMRYGFKRLFAHSVITWFFFFCVQLSGNFVKKIAFFKRNGVFFSLEFLCFKSNF